MLIKWLTGANPAADSCLSTGCPVTVTIIHLFSVLELSLTPSAPLRHHHHHLHYSLAAKAPYKALQVTPFKKTLSSEVQAGFPLDLLETHVHRGMRCLHA